MSDSAHIVLGKKGERAASHALLGKGFRILASNWRGKGAFSGFELDIVAEDKNTLVFVEVKTRMEDGSERSKPHHAFTKRKQDRLQKGMQLFLTEYDLWHWPCRFDLVCVSVKKDTTMFVEHIENVIESGNAVDCGDASWQPW